MSKIKSVVYDSNLLSVVLESGKSSSMNIDIDCDLSKLVNIEIFDQESIDDVLKSLGMDRGITFSLSKFFLGLGALEMGKSISQYVGFEFKDVDGYFTVTDVILDVLNR